MLLVAFYVLVVLISLVLFQMILKSIVSQGSKIELNLKKLIIATSIVFLVGLILWLLLTGRLNAIGALVIAVVTLLSRGKFWYFISKSVLKSIYSFHQFRSNSSDYKSKNSASYAKNSVFTERQAARMLGVKIDADEEAIKKAWRHKLHSAHPDKGGSSNRVQKLNKAKDIMILRCQRRSRKS